jgi:hypothetical protein
MVGKNSALYYTYYEKKDTTLSVIYVDLLDSVLNTPPVFICQWEILGLQH